MYSADSTFIKDMKTISKDLNCEFDNRIGKFKLTYKRPTGDPINVLWVEYADGSFKHPDQREINWLGESDTHRDEVRDNLNKASYAIEKRDEERKRKTREEFKDMTKDDKRILVNQMNKSFNNSKGNSTFRRIIHEPKGEVF